jgi:hypothetical protein
VIINGRSMRFLGERLDEKEKNEEMGEKRNW